MAGKTKAAPRGGNQGTRSSPKAGNGGEKQGGLEDVCDLVIDVDLEGVRSAATAGLRIGEALTVTLEVGPRYPVAVCKRIDGTVVGSLAGLVNLTQLINCLQDGVRYTVRVTSLASGSCRVAGGRSA